MATTRYKKRRCADCGAPVNQRVADADAGKTPYCQDHALGRAVSKMNQGFADLERETVTRALGALQHLGIFPSISEGLVDQILTEMRKENNG